MSDSKKNTTNAADLKGTAPDAKKRVTSKQVVALAGVILLVLMYIVTLFAAVFDSSASGSLFRMCLFSTIAIPLLIWVYTWMYGKLTGKKNLTDSLDSEEVQE